MVLRWKALLLFVAVSIALAAMLLTAQHTILLPAFARLERESADADLTRGRSALEADGRFLAAMATDYGAWDDTYAFAQDHNANYIRANLIPETFHNLHIDAMLFLDDERRLVWGGLVQDDSVSAVPPGVVDAIRGASTLSEHRRADSSASGIVRTSNGVALAGSAPITPSKRTGKPRGAVVMLRFIGPQTSRDLAERTRVNLQLVPAEEAGNPDAAATLPGAAGSWVASEQADTLRVYTWIRGADGVPLLMMRADLPRRVVARARTAAWVSLWTSLGACALLLVVLWIAITKQIMNPLARVTRHAVRVGSEDDLEARLNMTSNDEIGVLARAFDGMVDQVADSRRRLLDAAHNAGRSEIAVSVLHNVGNALNSVNVSASLIRDQVERSETRSVGQLATLLRAHQSDLSAFIEHDPHGKVLPHFVDELAARLDRERQALSDEVQALSDAIAHIRFAIDAQQEHVNTSVILETVTPSTLVTEALALAASPVAWRDLQVIHPRRSDLRVQIDRRRVLQILANLLANARQAVLAGSNPVPQIRIDTDVVEIDGADFLRFRVGDNGIGIPAENLERIFGFGFTTGGHGHGVGLHTAANLARDLGGALHAESAGAGCGAVFTLLVPMAMEGAAV